MILAIQYAIRNCTSINIQFCGSSQQQKPRKTDIERILMKPQYAMGLDRALLLFLRNLPDQLICTWGMYLK